MHPLASSRFVALLAAASLSLAGTLRAQEQTIQFPQASQKEYFKQRVGLTDVEVEYSRPNKNNREIFGALVPYGKLWRTGANQPTKIKFSGNVKLGDKEIPAGEYALFTIPDKNEWTVIVSKDAKVQSAADYKQENDAARITAKPEKLPIEVESFTIALTSVKGASAMLNLAWDTTAVRVPLTTDDVEEVSKQLETAAKGTLDPRLAFQAAGFYLDNNKDLNQAAKWIDQAIEKNPDAWFMHNRRAQIQQKLGNKKEATASAQKTIELLKKEKVPDDAAIASAQAIIDSSK